MQGEPEPQPAAARTLAGPHRPLQGRETGLAAAEHPPHSQPADTTPLARLRPPSTATFTANTYLDYVCEAGAVSWLARVPRGREWGAVDTLLLSLTTALTAGPHVVVFEVSLAQQSCCRAWLSVKGGGLRRYQSDTTSQRGVSNDGGTECPTQQAGQTDQGSPCSPTLLGGTSGCWASSHTGRLVLNQPRIQKAAADTCSGLPRKQLAYFSGCFRDRRRSWLSTSPKGPRGLLSPSQSPGPWQVPRAVLSCHLAAWEARGGQSHQGRLRLRGRGGEAPTSLMRGNQEVSACTPRGRPGASVEGPGGGGADRYVRYFLPCPAT